MLSKELKLKMEKKGFRQVNWNEQRNLKIKKNQNQGFRKYETAKKDLKIKKTPKFTHCFVEVDFLSAISIVIPADREETPIKHS